MTLIWKRITRERVAIAIMRFLAGQEQLEEGASRLHCFSRVWFIFFASGFPMAILLLAAGNSRLAEAVAGIIFLAGAAGIGWFVTGGLDEMVYRANCRIAEERKPWWNRKP